MTYFYMYPDGRISLRKKPDVDVVQPATKIPTSLDQSLHGNCGGRKVRFDIKIEATEARTLEDQSICSRANRRKSQRGEWREGKRKAE